MAELLWISPSRAGCCDTSTGPLTSPCLSFPLCLGGSRGPACEIKQESSPAPVSRLLLLIFLLLYLLSGSVGSGWEARSEAAGGLQSAEQCPTPASSAKPGPAAAGIYLFAAELSFGERER